MEFTPLTEEQLQQARSAGQTGLYKLVLENFIAADITSADVTAQFPGRKLSAVSAGLKGAQRKDSKFDGIQVVTLGDVIALIKK